MKKNGKNSDPAKKDIISEIREEFKRHTNILMEQMRHEVKTIAEGHGAIIRKLEEHDRRFDKIDLKFVEHDKKFMKIESELQSISMAVMDIGHEIKDHEKRIKKLEEKALL